MILITAPVHPWLIGYLQQKELAFRYEPAITSEEIKQFMPQVTGLVVTTRMPITAELMTMAPNLRWIGRLGSGMELIDTQYANSKNILCISTPEGNRNAVAEHALGMLLGLMNNIYRGCTEVRDHVWRREENRGNELFGKTVGIIGYGNTGEAFAKILSGFEPTILAYDPYRFDIAKGNVHAASLEQICKYADVISLHVPLTGETRHLANDAFFNDLQNKPYFINTSRGAVTDTRALLDALNNDKVAGAALDVLENERINEYSPEEMAALDALMQHDNVLITPHIAGYSHEAFLKMCRILVKKLGL